MWPEDRPPEPTLGIAGCDFGGDRDDAVKPRRCAIVIVNWLSGMAFTSGVGSGRTHRPRDDWNGSGEYPRIPIDMISDGTKWFRIAGHDGPSKPWRIRRRRA